MEGRRTLPARPPDQQHGRGHHPELIEGIPALHEDRVEPARDELVVQPARSPQHGSRGDAVDPDVVTEIDPFPAARPAQQKERSYGQHHADPLIPVEPLAEDQHGPHERHHRPCGVDRPDDRQRQMFDAEIAEYPRREYDARFQHDEQVSVQIARRTAQGRRVEPSPAAGRREDRRQEQQRRKEGIEQQHRQHGIVAQRLLLRHVVQSQQQRRGKSQQQPHGAATSGLRRRRHRAGRGGCSATPSTCRRHRPT